jgi:hypothetical protein
MSSPPPSTHTPFQLGVVSQSMMCLLPVRFELFLVLFVMLSLLFVVLSVLLCLVFTAKVTGCTR